MSAQLGNEPWITQGHDLTFEGKRIIDVYEPRIQGGDPSEIPFFLFHDRQHNTSILMSMFTVTSTISYHLRITLHQYVRGMAHLGRSTMPSRRKLLDVQMWSYRVIPETKIRTRLLTLLYYNSLIFKHHLRIRVSIMTTQVAWTCLHLQYNISYGMLCHPHMKSLQNCFELKLGYIVWYACSIGKRRSFLYQILDEVRTSTTITIGKSC